MFPLSLDNSINNDTIKAGVDYEHRNNMEKKMDAHKYTYRVTWSAEDNEFIGLCAEFPSLSWLDENQEKAFVGIVSLVCSVVEDMEANGEDVPVPLSERTYSGHFVVRTTPDVHRKLAIKAAETGVSLNRLVTSLF